MAHTNMLNFFTEDVIPVARLRVRRSRSLPFHEQGYNVCPSCGMEIIFENDHPGFCHCPECGSELVK